MQYGHAYTRPALLALVCLLCLAASARAQVPPTRSPLPDPTGYVSDYANVLSPQSKERLEVILKNLDDRGKVEFAVVTVPSLGGQDVFDYSLAVMRGWGIGSKEKGGLLLLFSMEERKGFVQVSRHLEGDMPDSLVGSIARKYMRPAFQQGDYGRGVTDGVLAITATLAEARGFSVEGIDQSYVYREPRPTQTQDPRARRRSRGGFSVCGIAFFVLIILIIIIASGRRGGGGGSGCMNLLLLNALFNAAGSGRGSSGWGFGSGGFGGGGQGGSWGGGGGGFGGFSGGGGDAGGGGAGFDW